MKTVWKQPLDITDIQQIYLPEGAEILSCAMQFNLPTIWFLVDAEPKGPLVEHVFRIAGTGHLIEEDRLQYIGTVHDVPLGLVWHLFEVTDE